MLESYSYNVRKIGICVVGLIRPDPTQTLLVYSEFMRVCYNVFVFETNIVSGTL